MNVLIITPHLRIGGVPRYVLNLAKGLSSQEHNVSVASSGGEWESQITENGSDFIRIPLNTKSILSFKIWRCFFMLSKVVKEQQIDVIHANTRVGQVLAWLLSKTCHVPFVSTYHGYYKAHFFRRLIRFDGIKAISISNEIKKHIVDDLKISSEKISVVHNGIDIAEYNKGISKSILRDRYNISGEPLVGIVARISPEKNHVFLIDAFMLFLKKYPKATLLIFGTGRQEEVLHSYVKEIKIEESVKFIRTGDVKEIFSLLDVSILPSLQEGFGFSIIEAQALGIPVIGSNIGGIKEVIDDNISGLIFERFDPGLLCEKIELLTKDTELRNRLISTAFEYLDEKFSLSKMTEGTVRVYKEALKNE